MDFKKKSTTTTNKNPSSQITKKGYQPLKFKSDHTQGINPEQFYLENFCKSYTTPKVNESFKPVVKKPKSSLSPKFTSSSESDYDENLAKDHVKTLVKKKSYDFLTDNTQKSSRSTIDSFKIPKKKKAVNDENQPKLEACIENKKEADLKTMIDVNSEHVKRMMLLAKGMKIEKSPESLESRTQSKFMKMTPQKELKEPLGENIDHLQLITKIKKSLKTEKSFESSEAISESKLTPEKKIKEPLNENTDPLKLIKKLSAYSKPEKSPSNDENCFLFNDDHWIPNNDFNQDNQEIIDSISHLENVKRISSSLKEDTTKKKGIPFNEVTTDYNSVSPKKSELKKPDADANKPESPKVASIFNIKKKSDQERKNRKFDYIAISTNEKLEQEIDKTKKLMSLNAKQIEYMILKDVNYFLDIFSGNVEHSWRHTEYKKYSKKSGDLLYSHAAGMGSYTQDQILAAVTALQSIFCRKNNSLDEYIVKVVLPEALIKICMRIYQCSKDAAEEYLRELNLKKETDSCPSESYAKL